MTPIPINLAGQLKSTFTKVAMASTAALLFACATSSPEAAQARTNRGVTAYDGAWHLIFATRAGSCDPAYAFDVNIANGVISHPNLVMFHGTVRTNGAVHASVTVHDKYAVGSGHIDLVSGQGTWRGHSGSAACSGYWTAQKG
jgi:hypothetical protein